MILPASSDGSCSVAVHCSSPTARAGAAWSASLGVVGLEEGYCRRGVPGDPLFKVSRGRVLVTLMSQPAAKKRLYVLDFKSTQVTADYASHGRHNGPNARAVKFKWSQKDFDMVPLGLTYGRRPRTLLTPRLPQANPCVLSNSPELLRNLDSQAKFGPLVGFRERVAGDCTSKAALRPNR
jgi:hypothetical protein